MTLRAANHNRKRIQRRAIYRQAFAYHTQRTERLARSGNLHRLTDSGFIRRHGK